MFVQCGYEEIRTNALTGVLLKKLMEEIEMTITHNGKEITLTAEQEKALFGEDKHRTGYERAEFEESYYLTNAQGETLRFVESGSSYENDVYEAVNYHSDKTIAQNNARADALMRNLRRFSAEHEGVEDSPHPQPQQYENTSHRMFIP